MTSAPSSRSPVADFPLYRLREAELSRIWEGQTFPPEALTARDGARLRVIYRGRRAHGPGPDFRDAIIAAPYGLLEGDVELHLRSSDFRRHGHHLDAAYDNVALHLVLRDDESAPTRLASGRRVPTIALGDWLEHRAETIEAWLNSPERWQEPCRGSLERMGRLEVGRTLDRLGDMRFRALAAGYRRRLARGETPDGVFWEGLLDALGYGGHRERFRALAAALPWSALRPLLALPTHEERRQAALHALHAADAGPEPSPRGSLRPANRFSRRLEGAAALAARYPDGLAGAATSLVALEERDAAREIIRRLTVRSTVGRSRAVEVAANVALPLLAAVDGGRHERVAERLYALLPLPARYGSVRHLHEAVGGNREQGMRNMEHGTGNGEQGAWNLEHGTGNGEQGAWNLEHGTGNAEPEPWSRERGTWNWEQGAWNLEHGTGNAEPGPWSRERGTWNWERGAGTMGQGTRNMERGTGSLELGTWNWERGAGTMGQGTRDWAHGTASREQGTRDKEQGVPVNARRQQGMLYLLKQYCTQGGCGRCPLS